MFTFEATPDGGDSYEIEATSRDVVLWEKLHRDHSLKRLESNLRMTDMYGLAHVAARRQGLFSGSLDDFTATVDLVPMAEEEGESSGPTSPDR